MTLRGVLSAFDAQPGDRLTEAQRDWLLKVVVTRDIYRERQLAVEARIAEVAEESQAEDPGTRRRREFWARVTPQQPAARVVLPFERRHA